MVERNVGGSRATGVGAWVRRSVQEMWPAAVLVLAVAAIARWVDRTLLLPESAYRGDVLAREVASELLTSGLGLFGLLGIGAVAVVRTRELFTSWADLTDHRGIRALMLGVVGWATWAAVTFDHNLFYDQSFNFDRALLVGLAALVVWRPVFVIPFLFLFEALEHQFDHPFGRQIFSRAILEHLLVLFMAWLLVAAIIRRKEARTLVFVASVLLASFYWYPGLVKLGRNWLFDGTPYLGGFAAFANEWLGSWPIERVDALLETGRFLDGASRIFTLVSELGAVLFFAHRLAPRILLISWAVLHAGIWVFSGVSFLVWIAVDFAFLGFLFLRRDPGLFTPAYALAGAGLIILSPIWLRPPGVGWFDTPLVYTYRYVAVDSAGNSGDFPQDATPRGQAWCARDYPYVLSEPSLLVQFGKTNDGELARRVAGLDGSLESIAALEEEIGEVHFDDAAAADLDRFLAETGRNWNERQSWDHPLSWAAPPATCLWPRAPREAPLASGLPIETIHVEQLTFFFDGDNYQPLRRIRVRTVEVPG